MVGDLPKHFIKSLLVLKEEDRMTATQALAHPWFSLYENIKDIYVRRWAPRKKSIHLVERITSPLQIRRSNTPLPSTIEESDNDSVLVQETPPETMQKCARTGT